MQKTLPHSYQASRFDFFFANAINGILASKGILDESNEAWAMITLDDDYESGPWEDSDVGATVYRARQIALLMEEVSADHERKQLSDTESTSTEQPTQA